MEFRQTSRCTCFTNQIKMSSVTSLYLPRVFVNIDTERIRGVIEEGYGLGAIDRIDRVPKVDDKGVKYDSVYVHFKFWYDTETARNFQEKLATGTAVRIVYDDPWYWNAFVNKSAKREVTTPPTKAPLKSPPRINKKSATSDTEPDTDKMRCVLTEMFDEFQTESFDLVDVGYVERLEEEIAVLREALRIAYTR
jgi:hypothetical protein